MHGAYPELLLREWDGYRTEFGSDSIRPGEPISSSVTRNFEADVLSPDGFNDEQHYVLIVLSHGGPDLENFKFDSSIGCLQAASVFWQVADGLARAEDWASFEVRECSVSNSLKELTGTAS